MRKIFIGFIIVITLISWREIKKTEPGSRNNRVHENYNLVTGVGDDVRNSDSFYSCGGLRGLYL